jgi:hypothetical protein
VTERDVQMLGLERLARQAMGSAPTLGAFDNLRRRLFIGTNGKKQAVGRLLPPRCARYAGVPLAQAPGRQLRGRPALKSRRRLPRLESVEHRRKKIGQKTASRIECSLYVLFRGEASLLWMDIGMASVSALFIGNAAAAQSA